MLSGRYVMVFPDELTERREGVKLLRRELDFAAEPSSHKHFLSVAHDEPGSACVFGKMMRLKPLFRGTPVFHSDYACFCKVIKLCAPDIFVKSFLKTQFSWIVVAAIFFNASMVAELSVKLFVFVQSNRQQSKKMQQISQQARLIFFVLIKLDRRIFF